MAAVADISLDDGCVVLTDLTPTDEELEAVRKRAARKIRTLLSALDAANRRAELLEKIDAAFAGGLRSNETMVAHAVLDIALKAAAEIAMDHKGSAERKRTERGLRLSKFSAYEQDEGVAEERGEDIASEMIAAAILALTSEGTKP